MSEKLVHSNGSNKHLTIIISGDTSYFYEINKIVTLPNGAEYRNRFKPKYIEPELIANFKQKWEQKEAYIILKTKSSFIPLRSVVIEKISTISTMTYIIYRLGSPIQYSADQEDYQYKIEAYSGAIKRGLLRIPKHIEHKEILVFASSTSPLITDAGIDQGNENQTLNEMDVWGNLVEVLSNYLDFNDLPFLKIISIAEVETKTKNRDAINLLGNIDNNGLALKSDKTYEISVLHEILTPPKVSKTEKNQDEQLHETSTPPKASKTEENQDEQLHETSTPPKVSKTEENQDGQLHETSTPPKVSKTEENQDGQQHEVSTPSKVSKTEENQDELRNRYLKFAPYRVKIRGATGALNILTSEAVANGKSDRLQFLFSTNRLEKDQVDRLFIKHNLPGDSRKHTDGEVSLPITVKSNSFYRKLTYVMFTLSVFYHFLALVIGLTTGLPPEMAESQNFFVRSSYTVLSNSLLKDFAVIVFSISTSVLIVKYKR